MTHHLQTHTATTSTDTRTMEAELNELRRHLERQVALRTTRLVMRTTLLESCNASLCVKLDLALTELIALKQWVAAQVIPPHQAASSMPIKQAAAAERVLSTLLN